MTAPLPALLIQAFAEAFPQGNGAAVVLLDQPADPGWMQAVAASFKQSGTAFLLPWPDPGQTAAPWALRWFTPSCEVHLCGHATLAAALALAHWGVLAPGVSTQLLTRSGPLAVALDPASPGTADLVLPASSLEPCPLPQGLRALLGVEPLETWRSGLGYWVARLPSRTVLADLDGPLLARSLGAQLSQGLVLMQEFACAGSRPTVLGLQADYQLRFFAPGLGIDEDPVTGSAHALVAPWWCERLGRTPVVGWQASKQGGGMVCEPHSSGMIHLTGRGQLVWDGVLMTGCAEGAPGEWRLCLNGG
jgi:predicted PhzF superfamily epimerase YddE/YHI9